ncbi:hypothetical protein BDZ89DRAFT_1050324 [Hymenopellis radicata]|nr:hypothetical protein BDZ89DRAFT_1050324 [Hymenopellis radicata]
MCASQADLEQGFVGPWLGGGVVWSLTPMLWIVSCRGKPVVLTTVLARRPTEIYNCLTTCGGVCLCDYLCGNDNYLHEDNNLPHNDYDDDLHEAEDDDLHEAEDDDLHEAEDDDLHEAEDDDLHEADDDDLHKDKDEDNDDLHNDDDNNLQRCLRPAQG